MRLPTVVTQHHVELKHTTTTTTTIHNHHQVKGEKKKICWKGGVRIIYLTHSSLFPSLSYMYTSSTFSYS